MNWVKYPKVKRKKNYDYFCRVEKKNQTESDYVIKHPLLEKEGKCK